MKKILFLLFFNVFIFSSCNTEQGIVTGIITYYSEESSSYLPDTGASLFFTKENIINTEYFLQTKSFPDEIYHLIPIEERDSMEIDRLAASASSELREIMVDKKTIIVQTKGDGTFKTFIPTGDYNLIVISKGKNRMNPLENTGCITIKKISVKPAETLDIDFVFEN